MGGLPQIYPDPPSSLWEPDFLSGFSIGVRVDNPHPDGGTRFFVGVLYREEPVLSGSSIGGRRGYPPDGTCLFGFSAFANSRRAF